MESRRMCLKSYIRKLYYEKKISNDEMKCLLEKLEGHDKHLIRNERNGWIPCIERLPEESLNSVIGWDAYRERCVFVQYLQGQWKLGDWESVKITHWMNMPEKPKGE